jgi:hypothetical protein
MGVKSFFGFGGPSSTDMMGPAGTELQEKVRREQFDSTGRSSKGPDNSREEMVTAPKSWISRRK